MSYFSFGGMAHNSGYSWWSVWNTANLRLYLRLLNQRSFLFTSETLIPCHTAKVLSLLLEFCHWEWFFFLRCLLINGLIFENRNTQTPIMLYCHIPHHVSILYSKFHCSVTRCVTTASVFKDLQHFNCGLARKSDFGRVETKGLHWKHLEVCANEK